MRPDAAEILRGVRSALLEVIAPDLQTPAVRAQAGYAAALLDLIAQEWADESERLGAEIEDLRITFGRLALALAPAEGDLAALAAEMQRAVATEAGGVGLGALRTEAQRWRGLLTRLAGLAPWGDGAQALPNGADDDLHALLRRTADRNRGFAP